MSFEDGDYVIISEKKQGRVAQINYNGKRGIIRSKSQRITYLKDGGKKEDFCYFVKILDVNNLSVFLSEEDLIPARAPEHVYLENLYRRYMRIRLDALGDALQIMREAKNLNEAMARISNHIHKNNSRAFSSPTGTVDIVLNRDVSFIK